MTSERLASGRRLFVGGLGRAVTEADLREAFLKVGVQLESIEVMLNPATGCSRGFALGMLPRTSVGEAIVSNDDLFQRMRTALVSGHAVTVLSVPQSASGRPPL
jgi:RNA recognition motif. (a.k.a. RRM, RBD, or RNP domain)